MSQNSGFGDDIGTRETSESGLAMRMGRGDADAENK